MLPSELRVAIVTGGAQGIGRGIAAHLLSLPSPKWHVGIVDRDPSGIADAQSFFSLPIAERRLLILQGDVGLKKTARDIVSQTVDAFGRLDLLVNNAGGGAFGTNFLDVDEDKWHNVINSNLSSTFFFAQAATPELEKTQGSIINISSTRALMSEPDTEAYAAAKGGVVSLTHAMAATLAPKKINVNCICPGWIDVSSPEFGAGREQLPLSHEDEQQHFSMRVGRASDVAEAVVYVHGARFMCGQVLTLDGGMTKKMIYHE